MASMQKHTAASGSAQDTRKSLDSQYEIVEIKAHVIEAGGGVKEDNDKSKQNTARREIRA